MAAPTTPFGNRSVANMLTLVYAGIRRRSTDPTLGLSQAEVADYIAHWDAYFYEAARWSFRITRKIFTIPQRTALSANLATSDTQATVSDNSAATAGGGRLSINQDEIDYTDVSGSTLITGLSNIDVSHNSGDLVDYLVSVPSNFGKPGEIWIGSATGEAINKLLHQDNRKTYWPAPGYFFFNNGYIYLPKGLPNMRGEMIYFKKAFKAAITDDLQTPEEYDTFVLWATMAQCFGVMGDSANEEKYYVKAGVPTPENPDPSGILQVYAARDAEQTDSLDDIFIPEDFPYPYSRFG